MYPNGNDQSGADLEQIVIVSETAILVPEGTYFVKLNHCEMCTSWDAPKLKLNFSIVEGEYSGFPLARFYNVKLLEAPKAAPRRFVAPSRGAYMREFRNCFPDHQERALDPNAFRDRLIKAKVVTVRKGWQKKELAASSHYSVIRELLEIVPDDLSSDV